MSSTPRSNFHTGTIGPHVSEKEMNYYSLHHLTALPESITRFADKTFSQERIERALHSRMEQFTNRDSDRFRQLLRWIKNRQTLRPVSGSSDTLLEEGNVSIIRREQFQNILEILGVFATQDQADSLFDKYDKHGRGYLTLHELMCRASSALENDFSQGASELASGRNEGPRSDDMFANKGKRQFLRQKLTGEGERPITPKQSRNVLSVPLIVKALREKLRINQPVTMTQSVPRSRREFAKVFEYYDPQQLGSITQEQLVRALHQVNFPLGDQQLKLLLEAFPSSVAPLSLKETHGPGGISQTGSSVYAVNTDAHNRPKQDDRTRGFDYVSLILYVYPDPASAGPNGSQTVGSSPTATSLFLNHELGREFFDNMSVEERRKRGLPPTHEQYEAMARAEKAAAGDSEEKEQQQFEGGASSSSLPSQVPTPRGTQSQFARERAPPTPQSPLSPSQHYINIAHRAPPASWSASLQKNPYLQTVLGAGASQPGFPFAIPQQNQTFASPKNGSQSARTWRESSSLSLPPASPRTPNGFSNSGRVYTPAQAQQQQLQQSSPQQWDSNSNALNPFGQSTSFIPNSAFLHAPRSAAATPRPGPGGPVYPPSQQNLPPFPAHNYAGAEAFANILAAPAPTRRPKTGITTYVRGGAGKPLPSLGQQRSNRPAGF